MARVRRRAHNEGSIYRRADGRWVAAVRYWEGGRQRRRAFYAATQAEARRCLTEARKATDDGLPIPSGQLTVGAYLAAWLEGKRLQLRPESFRRYAEVVRLHLTPELGRIALAKLQPENVAETYARLAAKGLSGTSVQLAHGVLRKALDDAMRRKHTARNVADLVDRPRRSTPEMQALTPQQAARLLDVAQGDPLEVLYVLAVTCGLRLGELQALRWQHVDLDARRLRVTATFQGMEGGRPVLADPKTTHSRRIVHLPELAVAALRTHRARQAEQRLQAGPIWQDFGLVFTTGTGHPVDGNNLRERSFARLLRRAGLPPMRFHDLRHTAATLLISQGVNVKVASEMLGHADVSTTLRFYAHVLPDMQGAAADAMDRLFARA